MKPKFFRALVLIATIFSVLCVVLLVGAKRPVMASDFEQIDNYKVDIQVTSDAVLQVTERITYNFGSDERHGIYRDIPVRYNVDGRRHFITLSNISVTQENGQPWRWESSRSGNAQRLKIGDPDATVTGQQTYIISYHVAGVLLPSPSGVRLAWNVVGTAWDVRVAAASVSITLPAAPLTDPKPICFTGKLGSTSSNCDVFAENNAFSGSITQPLSAQEGFTVQTELPAGSVTLPPPPPAWVAWLLTYGYVLPPLVILVICFYLWYRFGRDPKRRTIVPQYEPLPELDPLLSNALVHGGGTAAGLSAAILWLAEQGYLTIERVSKKSLLVFTSHDHVLTTTGKPFTQGSKYARELYTALFAGGPSINCGDLSDNEAVAKVLRDKSGILKELVSLKAYAMNPNTITGVGVVIAFLIGVIAAISLSQLFGGLGALAGILSGLTILGFTFIMPRRTELGARWYEYLLGLKLYLSVAEKDRLAFHNAPEVNPQKFFALLPYAVALGVDKAWVQQFGDITKNPPEWYRDNNNTGVWNAVILSSVVSDFQSNTQAAYTDSTSSGSGGSSGGGFGGGGGGSW